jgi:hypothetical protein
VQTPLLAGVFCLTRCTLPYVTTVSKGSAPHPYAMCLACSPAHAIYMQPQARHGIPVPSITLEVLLECRQGVVMLSNGYIIVDVKRWLLVAASRLGWGGLVELEGRVECNAKGFARLRRGGL